jgi:HEAT repeat protein
MASNDPETLRELMRLLQSDDLKDRMLAIQALGEIGDEAALRALRERMAPVNEEMSALVAVGNLKRRPGSDQQLGAEARAFSCHSAWPDAGYWRRCATTGSGLGLSGMRPEDRETERHSVPGQSFNARRC